MTSPNDDNVIAIGALGGSGTRAVAQLLIDAGIYMGNPLNFANDNTFFTACFMNPEWQARAKPETIRQRISVFEEYMRSRNISGSKLNELERLPYSMAYQYPPDLFPTLRKQKPFKKPLNTWGWKEPNTHIYLKELADYFPNLKYIHVLRHGLDMAFARNKKQLFNWGHLFGIDAHENESEASISRKQLDYWIKSSREIINTGNELLRERFYTLRYEDICLNPEKEIPPLLAFLGLSPEMTHELKDVFQLSEGSGRYKQHDLKIFSKEQLDAVNELGFEI